MPSLQSASIPAMHDCNQFRRSLFSTFSAAVVPLDFGYLHYNPFCCLLATIHPTRHAGQLPVAHSRPPTCIYGLQPSYNQIRRLLINQLNNDKVSEWLRSVTRNHMGSPA
ncbi:hypothetical protein LMH87_005855 [Akanthomyces muscarius]|uniref:Uncharacterized protein n=1 Tax=Akanthomyces muscarius TaxID=2231603 RepID=A0A9W8USA3_AKAMU|nr:hypothetical protein LMH87_005855 [Akanthomyces muscarius]KAJ4164170.1 hypothetical protein LMH87_005855 [Akanthomyces muscarius]